MAIIGVSEYIDYPVLPVNSLIVVEVSETAVMHQPGSGGRAGWDKLNFVFTISAIKAPDAPAVLIGTEIYGSVPAKMSSYAQNRTRLWLEILLGRPLTVGDEVDTDELKGKRAAARTEVYTTKAGFAHHGVRDLIRAE